MLRRVKNCLRYTITITDLGYSKNKISHHSCHYNFGFTRRGVAVEKAIAPKSPQLQQVSLFSARNPAAGALQRGPSGVGSASQLPRQIPACLRLWFQ